VVDHVALEGEHVRLEPLSMNHLEGLCAVGLEPELWSLTVNHVGTREDMEAYVSAALREQQAGLSLPYATVDRATGHVAGCTRFMNIAMAHRRLEIGSTWIAPAWQRTALNTEAKLLMLRHAFESLGCMRVELKTDLLNERSQKAILRLGAKQEGIFRNHMLTDSGRIRHSVWFSIIDTEWPDVKRNLESFLAR
jgi:N-acetyltransferase